MILQEEIQLGESRTLEFKKELPSDSTKWVKTVVAFANGAGGKIVIGVSNQREIVGIPKSVDIFEVKDGIADAISEMCEPQVMFDITAENILAYDKFLHKGNSTDATVFSYHKRLKFYINQARSRCSRATEGREYGEGSA